MTGRLLTIGDEILVGQVVDTNAAWLGEVLTGLGIRVERADTVGDDRAAIVERLREGLRAADLVVVTGGLGPTHDDVTKAAVMQVFGVGSRFDAEVFEHVKARFERRGLAMAPSNRSQAEIPEGFDVLPNPVGTAPGLWRDADDAHGILVVMPGVPHEMKTITGTSVVPRLTALPGRGVIVQRTLLTTGIGESALQERIAPVDHLLSDDASLAYLPSIHGVRLRVTGRGRDAASATERMDALARHVIERAGRWVYGEADDSLEAVVGRLLQDRRATVAVAESCTGGLVSHRLTNVAGASAWVRGSVVAYHNDIKRDTLGVPSEVLEAHGAVSRETALAMAAGVRRMAGAEFGLATTGIMGPGGGTPDKPVGTVWIAVALPDGASHAVRLRLGTDRVRNKERASTGALDLLRRALAGLVGEDSGPVA